jgi:hypothetical protein
MPGAAMGSSGGGLAPAPAEGGNWLNDRIHVAIIAPLGFNANPGAGAAIQSKNVTAAFDSNSTLRRLAIRPLTAPYRNVL